METLNKDDPKVIAMVATLHRYSRFVRTGNYNESEIWATWSRPMAGMGAIEIAQAKHLNALMERAKQGEIWDWTKMPQSLLDFIGREVDGPLAFETLGEDYFK